MGASDIRCHGRKEQSPLEKELRKLCFDLTFERYGMDISWPIVERLEYELDVIARNEHCGAYYLAYKLTSECRKRFVLFYTRGNASSSMLAFVLGITHVNPMQMHLYCPMCGNTDFNIGKYYGEKINARCGADLEKKVCPECGDEFTGDGYDIPFEMFSGINETPNFCIETADDIFHDLCRIYVDLSDNLDYTGKIVLLNSPIMSLINAMQYDSTVSERCIPFDKESIFEVLDNCDYKSIPYLHYPKCFEFENKPLSLAEITEQLGYSNTYFIDDNNNVKTKSLPLPKLPAANCDDIFQVLMSYGFSRETAYRITNTVKHGKLRFIRDDIEELRKADIPKEYLNYLTSIHSIRPRADMAEFTAALYKLMWYQQHFPEEYGRELKEYKHFTF